MVKALESLAETLQETYNEILLNIKVDDQEMAHCILIWLTFSKRPLKIEEVAEAAILNPKLNPALNTANMFFNLSNIVKILGSLVTYSFELIFSLSSISSVNDIFSTEKILLYQEMSSVSSKNCSSKMIKLTYFLLQKHLVSKRINNSKNLKFGIIESVANSFIIESCLYYIFYYDELYLKTISIRDRNIFLLLDYACRLWYIHIKAILSDSKKP